VKRIAIVVLAFCFGAYPAHADGIKGVAGYLGTAALSSLFCTLTVAYGSEEEEEPTADDFDRRGFFVGVGAGFAGEDFSKRPVNDIADNFSNRPGLVDVIIPGPDTRARADDSWSVKVRGGYRCHPRYSVGATFEFFGGFDTDWTGALGTGNDDIDVFVATADIKTYLLTGRYQPYLLLGGGIMNHKTKVTNPTGIVGTVNTNPPPPADSLTLPIFGSVDQSRSYTDFVVRLGGGLDIYATDHVVVNIDANYLAPLGEVSGTSIYTIGGGIEYRF
jgi:opacity protein-like surface antigen